MSLTERLPELQENQNQGYELEVEKNYRHNAIFNFFDGVFYWFGLSFMAPAVIMPLFVSHFTSNSLVIGLVAVVSSSGFFLPQLFTANWIEHVAVKRDVVVKFGFFVERLPVILLVPGVMLSAISGNLALTAVLVLFGLHCLGTGFTGVAWQDMLGKIIPLKSRGKFMGITSFAGMGSGILGASVATWLLSRYVFPSGYVLSFGIAALFIFFSWISIAQTREIPVFNQTPPVSNRDYWKNLPAVLKKDANFRGYIISQMVINLGGMAWGFLAVYALKRWNLSDGRVSLYNAWLLGGQAIGNLVFGALADRKGYKIVMEISVLLAVLSLALTILAPDPDWFTLAFVFRGLSFGGGFLSLLFILEFNTSSSRPTYIGLNNTIVGIFSFAAPLIGGLLADMRGYMGLFQVALVISLVGLVLLHFAVREPRQINARMASVQIKTD